MKKLLCAFLSVSLICAVTVGEADARTSSSKSSSSSSFKSSTPSYSKPVKSKPSVTKTKPSSSKKVILKKKTTTKPKVTTKPAPTKQKKVSNSKWVGVPYYVNGKFSTYLLTGTGAYLVYQGMESDGDLVYADWETGYEVDDDDLDELNVREVSALPVQKEVVYVEKDSNVGKVLLIIFVSFLVVTILILLFNRRKK